MATGINCERRNDREKCADMFITSTIEWSPLYFWSALIILLTTWYWTWTQSRFVRLINAIPGPKHLPLLGNLLDLGFSYDGFIRKLTFDWNQKYGGIVRVWLPFIQLVVVRSPEIFEPIFSSKIIGDKPNEMKLLKEYLGDSVLLLKGEEWKQRRRLLTPAFHFKILDRFVDVFNERSVEFAHSLDRAIEINMGGEFDIFPIMKRFSLDVLCETSMGQKSGNNEKKEKYLGIIADASAIVMERLLKPWLRIKWIFNLSRLGELSRSYAAVADAFYYQVIKERRELFQQEKEKNANQSASEKLPNGGLDQDDLIDAPRGRPAFLDTLLKAAEENPELTDEVIKDEVSLFMIAGHETTAFTFAAFLYLIAKHPEHQQLVVEELHQVFGDSNRPCTSNDFAQLKYLDCCIKETLRMYTNGPLIMRSIPEDLKAGNFTLPKGMTVFLNIHAAHHNPDHYPDPESFKPERFLPENSIGRHPYAFVPFSAGPRNCIGQKYAMYELRVVLANLLRWFRFSVSDPSAPLETPTMLIVLKFKNGARLIVSRRSNIP
uniref:Cytochrome p450 n=1 Tax=Daphnia magna TaxID=35525 RepID=A0A0P5QZ04_9CRUS